MTYMQEDLDREIEAKIAQFQSAGKPLVLAWLAKAIVDDHPLVFGKDAEVARFCAGMNIRREVMRHLAIGDKAETDPNVQDWEQAAANLRAHADELRRYQEQKT